MVETKRHRIFSFILLTTACCLYVYGLLTGYFFVDTVDWMIMTGILYLLMHYITLSLHKYASSAKWIIALFIIGITATVWFREHNAWLAVSVLAWNIAIFSSIHTLQRSKNAYVRFNPLIFFRAGNALFSTFFVISFIAAFIGRNTEFDLTCTDIKKASTSVITYTQEKFDFGVQELQQAKSGAQQLSVQFPSQFSSFSSAFATGTILGSLSALVNDTIENQKEVSVKTCEVVTTQIKGLYKKPGFVTSVILLMFLLLVPVMRITLYIISAINIGFFLILKKAKIYKISKKNSLVDVVE